MTFAEPFISIDDFLEASDFVAVELIDGFYKVACVHERVVGGGSEPSKVAIVFSIEL